MLFLICSFFGGWYFGKRGFVFEVKKNPPEITIVNRFPENQTVDFSLFWKVWNMISSEYLDRPVNGQKMLYGAIQGMVESLGDPYTSFLPPEINSAVMSSLNGTYEGIGAELGLDKNGQLIVVSPLDGSPAKAAGVQPGDKILKIEEDSTVGIAITEAVAKIRGQAGTISTLTLQRGAGEPVVVRIKREKITISSATWKDEGDGVVYIRLSRFGSDTNAEWDKVVSEINVGMKNISAIVLDVRGNPGGYLLSSVHVAGEFQRNKTVVFQEAAAGQVIPLETTRVGSFEKIPTYVLIDNGSASASEILAAALKDNSDAILIGTKSFGKGTIQDAKEFEGGSGLHRTVSKWLTPKKEWVHEVGLEPDVEVERTQEDITSLRDPQLDKALEMARTGATK